MLKLGAAAPGRGTGGAAIGESLGIVPLPALDAALGGADRPARKPPPLPEALTGALTLMVWPSCRSKPPVNVALSISVATATCC